MKKGRVTDERCVLTVRQNGGTPVDEACRTVRQAKIRQIIEHPSYRGVYPNASMHTKHR
jgi:hypothetical protein